MCRTEAATQGFSDWPHGRGRLARGPRAVLAGGHLMQMPWKSSSSAILPDAGEPIDFRLEDRSQPIHGTFVDGKFHSRWADYDADRVQSWRESDVDSSHTPIESPKASTEGGFIAFIKRLIRIVPRRRAVVPAVSSHSHARTNATATVLEPDATSVARHFDGNQISS